MNAQLWLLNETSSRFLSMTLLNCSFKKAPQYPANTSTLNQRWLSTFIDVVSTLIFGWKWKLSRRTFIDVVSTLAKQRWNNVDRITSIQRRWPTQCCFNVEIWLKMKVEPTYVYRRCFNVVLSTFFIELRRFNVDDSMLLKCRYLGENESWTNACLPALFWLW